MTYDEIPQRIYRRREIPIADYLMSFQHALEDEFMGAHSLLADAAQITTPTFTGRKDIAKIYLDQLVQHNDSTPDIKMWRARGLKYVHKDIGQYWQEDNPYAIKRYPTAMKLINEFGEDCPIANYSILGPNSKINRHTGVENRNGEYVRIHIPLIVPEGDLFFEVGGETITWDDIFAFNNQFVHSAHNNTSEWRLCFLIDISRKKLGLPPGVPYEKMKHLNIPDPRFGAEV